MQSPARDSERRGSLFELDGHEMARVRVWMALGRPAKGAPVNTRSHPTYSHTNVFRASRLARQGEKISFSTDDVTSNHPHLSHRPTTQPDVYIARGYKQSLGNGI